MWRFFNKLRASRKWVQALDHASRHQFTNALSCIEAIEALRRSPDGQPATAFDVEVQLLKAMLLVKLKKYEDALTIAKYLNPRLKAGRGTEGDYLRTYLSMLVHGVFAESSREPPDPELVELLTFDPRRVHFAKVPAHLVSKFPVPDDFRAAYHLGRSAEHGRDPSAGNRNA